MKNFIVVAASVKKRDAGLASFASYLHMPEHPNHKQSTSAITPIFKGENVFKNILLDTFKYEENQGKERAKNGTRGRYKLDSFAHSYMLSVPKKNDLNKHIRPSVEQWKLIFKDVANAMYATIKSKDNNRKKIIKDETDSIIRTVIEPARYNHISKKEFARVLFANIHEQKEGNDHLNIVVGKVINGTIIKELTQKAVLQSIKNTFTSSLTKHCDLSIENYKPVRTGRPEKRVSVGQAHSFKLKEQLESISSEYADTLHKSLRNLVRALNKNDDKLIDKWTNAVSKATAELKEKSLTKDSGKQIDETLEPVNEQLESKGYRRINGPRN